ncbi:hypothetical protein GGQ54_000400 [Naumannella cuiyingiana]|uniref:Uncharacterized protein n=1 Tax=Naumannella cuiyingiana TaxID=1347891 RepID=A0A7Z0D6P0_9ACTN|nr:Rv3235 family protein [Naumannella cuiyingiana]NYI69840.1 hypothetical protein [Naumannella cuiyingiana]
MATHPYLLGSAPDIEPAGQILCAAAPWPLPAAAPPPTGDAAPPAAPPPRGEHARRTAGAFARVFLEVISGRREAAGVAALLAPGPAAVLAGLALTPDAPRLLRVVARPAGRSIEAVAVYRVAERTGFLGFRLDRAGGRWRCSELAGPPVAAGRLRAAA